MLKFPIKDRDAILRSPRVVFEPDKIQKGKVWHKKILHGHLTELKVWSLKFKENKLDLKHEQKFNEDHTCIHFPQETRNTTDS